MTDFSQNQLSLPRALLATDTVYGVSQLLAKEGAGFLDVRAHAQRVEATSRQLAAHLGIEGRDLELVSFAARWHDAGKLLISNALLRKPGRLDPDERAIVERHAALGRDLLQAIPGIPSEVIQVAAYHHERYDGRGYMGLVGEEIPFMARIVNIADVHDALRSPRDYKPAMDEGIVLSIMTKDAPTPEFGRRAFDPIMLRQFVMMRLADPEVVVADETRAELATYIASNPMLDLPDDVQASGLIELDSDHSRRFYVADGNDRHLVMVQNLAGQSHDPRLRRSPYQEMAIDSEGATIKFG